MVVMKSLVCAGQQSDCPQPQQAQCYIMCCCSPGAAGHWQGGGAARSVCREPSECQSGQSAGHHCRHHNNNSALQPQYNEGQTGPGGPSQPDMVLDTSSHLWNGVSGVPGLGVSIPRSLSSSRPVSSLDEWDRHDRRQVGSRSSAGMSSFTGVKVDIPRVLSPRSSSCRSSGRSTGSRGSSALSQGLSNGSSASSSKYSQR